MQLCALWQCLRRISLAAQRSRNEALWVLGTQRPTEVTTMLHNSFAGAMRIGTQGPYRYIADRCDG